MKRSLNTDSGTTILDRKSLHQIVHNTGKHTALLIATRPKKYKSCSLVTPFWKKFQNSPSVRPLIIESVWHVPEYDLAEDIKDELKNGNTEKMESENFWIEYNSSQESITKLIGLQDVFDNNLSSVEPPVALIIIRPDLYVTCSILIEDESDIDKAISLLHTYFKVK
jgi:hypothetical protein